MYYVMRASAPSLHRESTDSLISSLFSHLSYLKYPMDFFLCTSKSRIQSTIVVCFFIADGV